MESQPVTCSSVSKKAGDYSWPAPTPGRIKCKLILGKPLEEQFKYTLHDGTIRYELGYTSEEKDIGVIIDSNLEFAKHVYF